MVAVEATASERLAALAASYWEERLRDYPTFATALGHREHDDRLSDITPEGRSDILTRRTRTRAAARAIPAKDLEGQDRITRSALITEVESEIDDLACDLEDWTVDPLAGPQVSLLNIESYQPVRTPEEGRAMIRRWRAMAAFVDDHAANLKRGLAEGKVAVRACVDKVIDELKDLMRKRPGDWPLLRPLAALPTDWSQRQRREFREALSAAVRDYVYPAFVRYQKVLESQVRPRARPQEKAGILHVPGGREAYLRLIRVYTALDLSPEELHGTGLREVARINQEMETLGRKVFGIRNRGKILRRLRTDPSLYFATRDEVAETAERALVRAKVAIPRVFGRLPKADCDVVRMGAHEEKHSTIAYYRTPAADGSRPGSFYVNTSAPDTRPRYEAEALAYHEAIPGHHLQIAISQELTGIPEFRRHGGVTAFVEGWGLYSERLADEMGLYSSDLDRVGMVSYDAWRACRLVVDTGMHAMRWSRQRAIDFMRENTALAENNIGNEVDRYIAWPAQALAYKTGQLEILRLRRFAEKRLGARFDLRRFHDAVLENGAVSLQALRDAVRAYASA